MFGYVVSFCISSPPLPMFRETSTMAMRVRVWYSCLRREEDEVLMFNLYSLATLCCCWLCGETCECCFDCLDCCF